MEIDKDTELLELKTEFATVVEVLGALHDFVESVFGTKFQNFISGGQSEGGGYNDGTINSTFVKNIQSDLKRLRSKHSKCDEYDSILSTLPGRGASRASKGDNGYSSGGTPVSTLLGEEDRRDSVSSQNNQMFSPTTESGHGKETENSCGLSIGKPEIIAVKCEVDDTDFFDDMDPFPNEHGSYQYEGDEPEVKVEDCYSLSAADFSNAEGNTNNPQTTKEPVTSVDAPIPNTTQNNSSSRFIPELIPIQSDPLHSTPTSLSTLQKEEDESGSSSSSNSDVEWHPSSNFNSKSSKRQTSDKKLKFVAKPKRPNQSDRYATTNFSSNVSASSGTLSLPRLNQTTSSSPLSTGSAAGAIFKCDMCTAFYRQEESLRSHQKYKHNPSRVQCTCHLCGKSMVDKYRLQRHIRLHTGEKPFECEYCGQSFYRKDYHTKHLQRKHGISYSAGPPSKVIRKPVGKLKPPVSSSDSPSSFTISSNSSASSSSFQSLRSGVFETPSPPPISLSSFNRKPSTTSSLTGREPVHRQSFISSSTAVSSSPSSMPTARVTVSPPTSHATTEEMIAKEHSNFVDIFPNHLGGHNRGTSGNGGGGGGGSISSEIEYYSNAGGLSNLMNMTSLTFDDLISADF